jgi:Glu-tRNA(Gln) amidotransferase subunit E-like FAD-binding protein
MRAYLPPNKVEPCLPSQHPLLKGLKRDETEDIRPMIIDIMASVPVRDKIRSDFHGLHSRYMGAVMRELRSKVDAQLAAKIIKEELEKKLQLVKD